jgi:hypothetical protein
MIFSFGYLSFGLLIGFFETAFAARWEKLADVCGGHMKRP